MGSSCIIIINSDEGELSWWNKKAVLDDGGGVLINCLASKVSSPEARRGWRMCLLRKIVPSNLRDIINVGLL